MLRHLILHKFTASPVGDTAHLPPCIRLPTRKTQDCRDSLGTVRVPTVMTSKIQGLLQYFSGPLNIRKS